MAGSGATPVLERSGVMLSLPRHTDRWIFLSIIYPDLLDANASLGFDSRL
jgi:hypothetical protein